MAVVLFSAALAGFTLLIVQRIQIEKNSVDRYHALKVAEDAAEAGLELATVELWSNFAAKTDIAGANLEAYEKFLDRVLSVGTTDLLRAPLEFAGGGQIDSIEVEKIAAGDGLNLLVTSTAQSNGVQRKLVQQFTIGGGFAEGQDYAILTKNLDCVMCHTKIDNALRVNNKDSEQYGTFDRVKIAAMDRLAFDLSKGQFRLAGSIHSRGEALTSFLGLKSKEYTGDRLKDAKGYGFDENGKLLEDKKGRLSESPLEVAGLGDDGLPLPGEHLYLDYPEAAGDMTDGVMPTEIPPVVPDSDGDRAISDDEWKEFVSGKTPGGLADGIIHGVPAGEQYEEEGLPTSSNSAEKDLASSGYYDGNLVLVGTESQPIHLKGDIYVNGDVMITGKVEGTGKIVTRNNIYFLGDTTMNDGKEYGKTDSGDQNLVGYSAGGSIVMGDFITARYHHPDDIKGKKRNREFNFNQKKDKANRLSYLNEDTIDQSPPLDKDHSMSFTSKMMAEFNRREIDQFRKDPTYRPRLYQMRDGDRMYATKQDGTHGNDHYDSAYIRAFTEDRVKGRAAIHTLAPAGGWMPETTLKEIWFEDNQNRKKQRKQERAFKIDGSLYTANGFFGISHKRHGSLTRGQMKIRGAITASELGIHATGNRKNLNSNPGLNLLYDPRVQELLDVTGGTGLALTRGVRYIEYAEVGE